MSVIPGMHYHDAARAIDWLCDVFGFTRRLVVPGPDDSIAHAELTFGTGMIMLGSAAKAPAKDQLVTPRQVGMANTRGVNLVAADPDAIYHRAKAAGAEIIKDIEDQPFGGRAFVCRDLEGHIWWVGSYDPWKE